MKTLASVIPAVLLATACSVVPPAHQDPALRRAAPSPDGGWTPVQVGIGPAHQLFARERSVVGLRLGLPSTDNRAVYGLDVNLARGDTGGGGGVAASLVWNNAGDDFYGAQVALVMNNVNGAKGSDERQRIVGTQVALVSNDASEVDGLQLAGLNVADHAYGAQVGIGSAASHFAGAQVGLANLASTGAGVQVGVYNGAGELGGAQVGLWNSAKSGLQFGLLNFNENGFLPVFPFVNF